MRYKAGAVKAIFGLALIMLLFLIKTGNIHAEQLEAYVDIVSDDYIALILGGEASAGNVSIDISPQGTGGSFGESGDVTATVISSGTIGHVLNMTTSSEALVNSYNSSAVINGISSTSVEGYEKNNVPVNSWGYSLKSGNAFGNYFGVGDGVELQNIDEPTNGTTSTIRFGAKVNSGTPSGSYVATITFTATAKVLPKTYIQDINISNCPTEPTTVVDGRDGEEYQIQKLADGNCWLLDNLRLDLTDANVQANLTSNTTNASDTTLNYLKNGGGTASDKYAMIGATSEWLYGQYSNSSPRINLDYKNTTGSAGYAAGKYGAYYSYCAASAGSYCYGDATTGYGTPVGNAEEDICPKGWHLPTGTGSDGYGEYAELYILLNNDATTFINALHLPVSGGYSEACSSSTGECWYEPYHQNLFGNYWTSTRLKNNVPEYMVEMQMGTSGPTVELTESAGNDRSRGMSVRCVMGNPKYSISYDSNNADAGTMTNVHRNLKSGVSVSLIASNFSRVGYGFAGWSTDSDAATKVANNQAVTIYGPNQIITINDNFLANADSNNNVKLYAVWLPQDSTYTMQTFGTAQCNAMNTNDIIALKDVRDNEVYTVAKLGDGHCWMTENLRINPATANITADNTNGPTQDFLDALSTATDATTLCNSNNSTCDDTIKYNLNDLNRSLTASPTTNNNSSSWYSYGGMYNWYTATAGNGLYSRSSGSVTNDGDICPTGWRLPTGGSGGEYQALNTAINGGSTTSSTNLVSFPANFVYSGDYNYNTSGGRGTYARLWSATATSNANAYRMGVAPAEVTPLKNWNKWDGFAVRCIVK